MTTSPAPAIHYGLSYEEYVARPGIRSSHLRDDATWAQIYYDETHRAPESAAQRCGHALHAALLEPDVFAARYVLSERATGAGSRAANAARKATLAAAGVVELDDEERAAVEEMRDAVLAHDTAGPLVRNAWALELSIEWTDAETGAPCKARLDVVPGDRRVVGDVKTCRRGGIARFDRDAPAYGYHAQAAHYLSGWAAVCPEAGADATWAWIVVESEPPYLVAVIPCSEGLLALGASRNARRLRERLECERTGEWPGYPGVQPAIQAPRWTR